MIILHILLFAFATITNSQSLTFPEASFSCPQFSQIGGKKTYFRYTFLFLPNPQLFAGHTGVITEIRHIPDTSLYISID